ncbi:MAG: hypothetical protein ACYS8Z_17305, partial [Planctomycetota bacterium]
QGDGERLGVQQRGDDNLIAFGAASDGAVGPDPAEIDGLAGDIPSCGRLGPRLVFYQANGGYVVGCAFYN